MRNIYQSASAAAAGHHHAVGRGYQYPSGSPINGMNVSGSRYNPMGSSAAAASAAYAAHMSGQSFPGMGHSTIGQSNPMTGVGRQDTVDPDDWYNKGFSALRMNSGPHPNLSSTPMY